MAMRGHALAAHKAVTREAGDGVWGGYHEGEVNKAICTHWLTDPANFLHDGVEVTVGVDSTPGGLTSSALTPSPQDLQGGRYLSAKKRGAVAWEQATNESTQFGGMLRHASSTFPEWRAALWW